MSNSKTWHQYASQFKEFSKKPRLTSAAILFSYIAQIIIAILVGVYFLHAGVVSAALALPLIATFIGMRFRGINNIVHECSHFAFTIDRVYNEFFGRWPRR